MSAKKYFFVKAIIIAIIVPALSFFSLPELEAKPKSKTSKISSSKGKKGKKKKKSKRGRRSARSYNPEKTRQLTLEMIKNNSEELSSLIGLEGETKLNYQENTIKKIVLLDTVNVESEDELFEEVSSEDIGTDFESFKDLWLSFVDDTPNDVYTGSGLSKKDIMDAIMQWVGTPYHFGGMTARGIDCSAFTRSVYFTANDITLPRTAQMQFDMGQKINKENLQFGDLVFFHTTRHAYASHVGIYLGDDLFAHSSSRYGVTVSSLSADYYTRKFIGARRLSANDMVRLSNGASNRN